MTKIQLASTNTLAPEGGRIGVVFGESPRRYLSSLITHVELSFRSHLEFHASDSYSLQKFAMQGFGGDRAGPPAT